MKKLVLTSSTIFMVSICLLFACTMNEDVEVKKPRRTRQTLWRAVQMLTQKLCCQTIHDCPKVVPLHYESE